MRTLKNTRKPRLLWRVWSKARLGAYAKRTGYIVTPTSFPRCLLAAGKTIVEGYPRFYTFLDAAEAALGNLPLRELVERGIFTRADLAEAKIENWDTRIGNLPVLPREVMQRLENALQAELRYRKLSIDLDRLGWHRVYYAGLVGYTGETLQDALQIAKAHAAGAHYLLAVPCYHIDTAPQGAPFPYIGTIRDGKAFAFLLT